MLILGVESVHKPLDSAEEENVGVLRTWLRWQGEADQRGAASLAGKGKPVRSGIEVLPPIVWQSPAADNAAIDDRGGDEGRSSEIWIDIWQLPMAWELRPERELR